jgi:hypothetical protein
VYSFLLPRNRLRDHEESRDGEEPEPDQQQPRDSAAAEGHRQSGIHPLMRRLRRTHVRTHRDDHADVTGNR